MDSRALIKSVPLASGLLATVALFVAGCTSSMTTESLNPSGQTGPAFVIATDAPLASVLSFSVPVSVCATNSGGTCVPLNSGMPTVDFARFNGLQTLLDMNDVPMGTYSSISITLGTPTIGYLNIPGGGGAPTIQTETGTYPGSTSTYTYTQTLTNPLVVPGTGGEPVGLRVDLDLTKTVQVSGGNFTGQVTPTFNIKTVGIGDSGGYVDTFIAAVVSTNAAGQSFVIQGPHGGQFTVSVSGSTEWEDNESISSLTTSSIVEVSGTLDKADATLDADDVAILSQNGFYAGGQITYVNPSSGPATSFDLYVRGTLPTGTGVSLGQIAQVDLTGNEKFFIYWWHNPLTQFLFNDSTLLPGQHVSVGGPASGATNGNAVTVNRVVLRHWGFNGTVVANSVNTSTGTFQMQITGFAGLLVPQTVTVYTAGKTEFRNGFTGMSSVTAGADVRVVGLLLKDPTSGNPVLLAHYIDEMP
jgi:Domain of unknown function (DUF5666)